MGGFFGNITLRGPTQAQVAECLSGRKALVSPNFGLFTVVFDSACDEQKIPEMEALNAKLTKDLECVGLALLVHDDDVLYYMLHHKGRGHHDYNSAPSYFDFGSTAPPKPPSGGNAKALCLGFGAKNEEQVEAILRSEKYVFQYE